MNVRGFFQSSRFVVESEVGKRNPKEENKEKKKVN